MPPDRNANVPATQRDTGCTIRCHRCSKFVGESEKPMRFVGVVLLREDVDAIAPPRATWRCKCGWTNIYVPLAHAA